MAATQGAHDLSSFWIHCATATLTATPMGTLNELGLEQPGDNYDEETETRFGVRDVLSKNML
jgi:hypothetical protein